MMRVLFFIKVPPPITGATLMNQSVYDSKLLREHFNIRSIRISYSKNVAALGTFSLKKIITFIKVFFALLSELLFHRPKFVYFQISPLGLTFYRDAVFVYLMKIFRVHIIFHMHGKGIQKKLSNPIERFFYYTVFYHQSAICLSTLLTFDLDGLNLRKIFVVNNGIPPITGLTPDNKLDWQNEREVNILFLSNLIKSKGLFDFLDALKLLKDSNISFKGVIAGNEGDVTKSMLWSEIEKRGLQKHVDYIGPKFHDEKTALFSSSDIFAFPTKNDAFPGVILEAFQVGLPVIASKEGGLPDIIDDGITGFLVPKSSPDVLAEKIKILINDSNLRKGMGNAARKKYLEKYTLEVFEENLKRVFEEVFSYCK